MSVKINGNETAAALALDEVFDVLVSPRRRAVLYELYGRSDPIALSDLAIAVTRSELNGIDTEGITADETVTTDRQVVLALDHVHLPKLQQAGLVEYDRTERTVQLNRIPGQFERYLLFAAEDEQRTSTIDATVQPN
ncbi:MULTISPECIES: helix-turn-helix domain-containing protein [unclassified Haladaptatus]|uniref:helix-turn-helix domain-containing protein n=1 Tax=unclassified Haladaptatus TaxID=2622732 RepID=UPI00209C6932|nr:MULTISPECIES: helix-turn-helix domain-containing protein [unclassified Haladaptatus]MCO8243330.1 helix-turn-helix domain-containing protein [Haladaptatus sp. AB643]MCO8253041.1 helix-turn-helix domain-containing protein [Haladaptatus sp. AB618]